MQGRKDYQESQFLGMRKVNTRGLAQANKVMQMAAIAYNLKKYLKFIEKRAKSGEGARLFSELLESINPDFISLLLRQKEPSTINLH